MILNKRITIFLAFLFFSVSIFAQKPAKTQEQAKAEAEAKARAKAEAKEREERRKFFEQNSKAESSQAKLGEAATAAVNAKAEAFYLTAMSQINEKHIAWIKQSAEKINEKNLDQLAIKLMANYYGKNAGLSEMDIDGLLVLLLRESYVIAEKEYSSYSSQATVNDAEKAKLLRLDEMLADSTVQINAAQLDSINLLLQPSLIMQKDTAAIAQSRSRSIQKNNSPVIAANKKPANAISLSDLSLTKIKLAENIESLSAANEEQTIRMQQIKQRQQKITYTLSKIVNEVSGAQDSIISNLK